MEIFSRIIDSIEKKVLDKEIKLNKDNFKEIKKQETGKKVAFIDGGQAELLKAVNFSLQLIRTAVLIFKNNKKIHTKINEFFVLTTPTTPERAIRSTSSIASSGTNPSY